jgi:serine/threonine protein kinase
MARKAESAYRAGDVVSNRYRLIELIGSGGMSVVFRAHDEVLDRPVAVKMLAEAGTDRFRRQLRAEARAYGRLNTPRIAQVYDYGETDTGAPYLVMEYVTGVPLAARLRDGAALPWPSAVVIVAQVADALRDAHAHGLAHRDVKPDNVILTDTGAKLVDFGICAMIGAPDSDEDGRLLGTPAYVAPERIADAPVNPAADVYALGVLLFRALSGHLPWPADTGTGLLKAHLFTEPTPLPPIDGLPPEIAEIGAACLRKEPHTRPSSAELANTLWLAALASDAPISPAPVSPPWPITGPNYAPIVAAPAVGAAGDWTSNTQAMDEMHTAAPTPVRPRHRRRYAVATSAIMLSVALLGVAWGALDASEDTASSGGASACAADATAAASVARSISATAPNRSDCPNTRSTPSPAVTQPANDSPGQRSAGGSSVTGASTPPTYAGGGEPATSGSTATSGSGGGSSGHGKDKGKGKGKGKG